MKCPNCNSSNIQFGTSTKSSNFSDGDACCGFILMGPLGLLCGLCGSETSTEEFWICQNCGNKFTTEEGKQAEKEAEEKELSEREKYHESLKIKEDALNEYGSFENIKKVAIEKKRLNEEIQERFDNEYNRFLNSDMEGDKRAKKLNEKVNGKKLGIGCSTALVLGIVGLLGTLLGIIWIGLICIIIAVVIVIISSFKDEANEQELIEKFIHRNADTEELFAEARQKMQEDEHMEEILNAFAFCEEYESRRCTKEDLLP